MSEYELPPWNNNDPQEQENPVDIKLESFRKDLEQLLNKYSMENFWDMPDFLMAEMITCFIENTGHVMKNNLNWHGCDSVCHPKTA